MEPVSDVNELEFAAAAVQQDDEEEQSGSRGTGHELEQLPLVVVDAPFADEDGCLPCAEGQDDDDDRDDYTRDFAHLPWYRRPSIEWALVPYLVLALIYGGIISPKINLIVDLVCRHYYSSPPTPLTLFHSGTADDGQCRTPEVSQRVSLFMLVGDLLGGILPAIVSPRLGALSDLYGRKPILILGSLGSMGGEIVTILVASNQDTMHVNWMLLSFFLDGLTGSAILAMAMVNTYATDCVPPHRRSTAFSYFHGCAGIGIAVGPILTGYIVAWSGRIVTVFWITLGVHVACALFVLFLVPESVSRRRRDKARRKAREQAAAKALARSTRPARWQTEGSTGWAAAWRRRLLFLRHLDPRALLEPLKILYPTGPGSSPALRRNLLVLAAMDTIMFAVAMGSGNIVLIYANKQFGWATFESGRFMTSVGSTRVIFLMVVWPVITHLVRRKSVQRSAHDPEHPTAPTKGCDWFDLTVVRVGITLETLGWVGYSLAGSGALFTLSGMIGATGGVSSPALQSALTRHVPSDQTGQLLGANGLLHALTLIVAPVVFNAVYAATVGHFAQAAFVCLAFTFATAFVLSWLVRPHVFWDTDETDTSVPGPSANAEWAESE